MTRRQPRSARYAVAGTVLAAVVGTVAAPPAASHGDGATPSEVTAVALRAEPPGPRLPRTATPSRLATRPLAATAEDPAADPGLPGAAAPEAPRTAGDDAAEEAPPEVPGPAFLDGRTLPGLAGGAVPGGAFPAPTLPEVPAVPAPPSGWAEAEPAVVWTSPVPSGHPISAAWGIPGDWAAGRHTGVDFAVPTGTPLYAVGPGTVETVGESGDYGRMVILRMDDGHYVLYAHLSETVVTEGQELTGGEHIGDSGNTGRSTGPHLHFEVRTSLDYGSDVDPLGYLAEYGVSPTSAAAAERAAVPGPADAVDQGEPGAESEVAGRADVVPGR